MNLNLKKTIVFFDVETTGVQAVSDRIVELSAVKIKPDQSRTSKTWRINPTIPIPEETSLIHGIYDKDVKEAPTFAEVAGDILDFFQGCDLGGYNLRQLDIPVLVEECLRIGKDFKLEGRQIIDVFKVFQIMEKRTLGAAYKFYCDKELVNAHSAEADVIATVEVLEGQLDRYTEEIKNEIDFLHEFTMDADFVDTGRRLIRENGSVKFNFGKHKGKDVEVVLKEEPQYLDWILRNNFLQDTKNKLTALKLKAKFGK